MLKTLTAGAVALTIAGAGVALAQSMSHGDARHAPPSAQDLAAFTDARIAALKAGLKLTAEQEKQWPAVEAALRELAKERAERMAARHEARQRDDAARRPDTIERLRRGADMMGARAAALKQLADAAEPLYKSLDDSQKRRFSMLLRMGGRPHGHWHGRRWERRADIAR
jgi:zinc resistance-associated protein